MNLEPIIDLVENTQAPYLHYARKVMTAKERKRLLQLLPCDRLMLLQGQHMRITVAFWNEIFRQSGLPNFVGNSPMFDEFWSDLVDGLGTPKNEPVNLMVVIENADQVLCDVAKSDRRSMTFDKFVQGLARAGNYAARINDYFNSTRPPVGFNVIFLFDPKNKKIDVGSANHLKL